MSEQLAIPTGDAAIVMLAEALGRHRALSDVESFILERAMNRQPRQDRRWSKQEDATLLAACGTRVKNRARSVDIAKQLNRTPDAVRRRLCDLRKKERGR